MRAAYKFEPMASYNGQRKAREALARQAITQSAVQWSNQITALIVLSSLMVAAALIGVRATIWVAAMGAIGGIALFSAIFGLVAHRMAAQLGSIIWTAAIVAIDMVFVVAIGAQFIWR